MIETIKVNKQEKWLVLLFACKHIFVCGSGKLTFFRVAIYDNSKSRML